MPSNLSILSLIISTVSDMFVIEKKYHISIVLMLLFVSLTSAAKSEILPLNPDVRQETIQRTICVKGWTAQIRPPVSYTNHIKKLRLRQQGLPLELIRNFQLDHRLPLSLGGSPGDPRNLLLQDLDDAEEKDIVERCLPAAVCAGALSLVEAQQAIWRDWRSARRLCAAHY